MLKVCRLVYVCWFSLVTFINASQDEHGVSDDLYEHDVSDDLRIDEDYYFGSSVLRSEPEWEFCMTKVPTFICRLQCFENHICVDGQCRCLDRETKDILPKVPSEFIDYTSLKLKGRSHPIEYSRPLPQRPTRTSAIKDYKPRPVLRHHIAHFCADLDDARVCIRKCMKTGKPAFCGKDHVCYCGHKYADPVEDQEDDGEAIYAEFKDMYQKYFGNNYRPT